MDIKIRVTEKHISMAISKEINAIVSREVGRIIKKFYRQDFTTLKPSIEKYVRESVMKALENPEMIKFLKDQASEVARIKTASFIRNNQHG